MVHANYKNNEKKKMKKKENEKKKKKKWNKNNKTGEHQARPVNSMSHWKIEVNMKGSKVFTDVKSFL